MRIMLRIKHDFDTFVSWLFDGDGYIDCHLWEYKSMTKKNNKYYLTSQCDCGKKSITWMTREKYLMYKDHLPKLTKTT